MGPAETALGIKELHVGEGTAQLAMTITETMLNVHGIGHGGYVFLLADSAFAIACNRPGSVTVAAQAEIDFIAAVHLGDELVATAVERVVFGRSGLYDITVTRGDEVVAEFRGRSRTIR